MRIPSPLILLSLGGAALARQELDFLNWAAPGPSDVRGPCPALNSLANHNLIPHSGRNITAPLLVDILGRVFNLSLELAETITAGGLATRSPDATAFDLPDLNRHNAIEHDASLSRADLFFTGPDRAGTFDCATFDRFFAHLAGADYVSAEAAAAGRYGQVRHARAHNPNFTYGLQQQVTGYAETALYMSTMVDGTGRTRTEFVRVLFEEERLPFREGWRPPTTQVNGLAITQGVLEVALATPEKSLWCGWGGKPANQTTFDIPGCFGLCQVVHQLGPSLLLGIVMIVLAWRGLRFVC